MIVKNKFLPMATIKQDGEFSIVKNDDRYEVCKGDEILKTPGGCIAYTKYLDLAERLMRDWKERGYESYTEPDSILCYHLSYVENFKPFPRDKVMEMINSTNWENDWSLKPCPSPNPHIWMKWVNYFGQNKENLISQWLDNQSIMQLVASACVLNVFGGFNVPYYMAIVVEDHEKKEHKKMIKSFYDFYSLFDPYIDFKLFWNIFDCFRLYYGIHLKEQGEHLPSPDKEELLPIYLLLISYIFTSYL